LRAGWADGSIAELEGGDLQRPSGIGIRNRLRRVRMPSKSARAFLGAVPDKEAMKEIGAGFSQAELA